MPTIDDFKKIEMRIGEILHAEPVEGSEKLLKLSVSFGEEKPRQVLSGIARFFGNGSVLVGKRCGFVTNLPPREMMGLLSEAMILASVFEDTIALYEVPNTIPLGTRIG